MLERINDILLDILAKYEGFIILGMMMGWVLYLITLFILIFT